MLTSTVDHRRAAARPRILWRLVAVSLAAGALLVACGSDDYTPTTIAPAATVPAATTAPTSAGYDGY